MKSQTDKKKLDSFLDAVNALLRKRCGITWLDATRDLSPLQEAIAAGETPEQFVHRFTRTDGLARMSNAWGY